MKDNHTQNYDEEEVNNDELKSEKQEEEEDTIRMMEWELEWWQKADARLVF